MSSERFKGKANDPLSPFDHEMNKEKTKYHANAKSKATLPEETGEKREPSQFDRGFGEIMKETAKDAQHEATATTRTLFEQISDTWERLTSKPEDTKELSDKATQEIREQYEAAKERAGDTTIKATSAASEAIRKGQQEAIRTGKKGKEYREAVENELKKLPDSEKEGLMQVTVENKDQKKSIAYPHEKIVGKDPFGMTPEVKSREYESSAKALGIDTADLPEVKNKRGIPERNDTSAKSGIRVPESEQEAKENRYYLNEKLNEGKRYASSKAQDAKDMANSAKENIEEKANEGKGILSESKDYLLEKGKEAKDYVAEKAKEGKDFIAESIMGSSEKAADVAKEKAKEGKDYISEKSKEGKDYLSEKAKEGKDYITEKSQQGKDRIKEKSNEGKGMLSESKDYVLEKGKEAKDYVAEKAKEGKDYISEKLGTTEKKGSEMYNKSKDKVQEATGKTRDFISDKSKEAQDEVDKALRREPSQKGYKYSHQFIYDDQPSSTSTGSSLLERAKEGLMGAGKKIEKKGEEAKDYMSEKARETKDVAQEKLQQAKDYISETGEMAQRKGTEKAKETKEYLGDKAQRAKEYTNEKARDSKEYLEDKSKDAQGYMKEKSEEIKEKAQRAYERPPVDTNWLERTFHALKNMTPNLWWYDKREKAEETRSDFEKARDYHNQQMARLTEKHKKEGRERDEKVVYEKKKADPEFMRKVTDYFSMEMAPGDEPIPPTEQTVGQFIKKRARAT